MSRELSPEKVEQLVEKAQSGHQKSFEKIFEYFFDRIYRYTSFRVKAEDTDDIVGDIFLKVVQKLNTYTKTEKASFKSWIFRVAHNTIIDFYRKPKDVLLEGKEDEDVFFQIPDTNPTPDETTHHMLESQKLTTVLRQIPSQYREILELKYLEGFENNEIAHITGKTTGNVRILQLRALRSLREKWDECDE